MDEQIITTKHITFLIHNSFMDQSGLTTVHLISGSRSSLSYCGFTYVSPKFGSSLSSLINTFFDSKFIPSDKSLMK